MAGFYSLDNYTPSRSIGYLVRRAGKLMTMQTEAEFADLELSFAQWVALTAISHKMADNCAGLARLLGHNSGATTRLVDQLEQRGLVERCRTDGDRRIVNVALTPAGEGVLATQTVLMVDLWNALLADFSRGEIETFIGLLGRLGDALEAREAGLAARS